MTRVVAETANPEYIDVGSVQGVKRQLLSYLVHNVGVSPETASPRDWLYAVAGLVRGILSENYLETSKRE
ncbi:MAG: hypothetical protein WCZ23_15105, partial [Rhodospirillaceae bacterium]